MKRLRAIALAALAATSWGCAPKATPGLAARASDAGLTGVLLAPERPFVTSTLSARLGHEVQAPAGTRWEWRRNGAPVAGVDEPTLAAGQFRRGDRIQACAVLPDGRRAESAEVTIENSPPHLTRVHVINASGALEATVEALDPDGDATSVSYQWYRNGQPVAGANAARYSASAASFGDKVAVEVVARDGQAESAPLRADPAALDNRAPMFSSTPANPTADAPVYRYQVAASDADGDALTYALVSGPAGMTVSPSGALEWPLPPAADRKGEYRVVLQASDGKGGDVTQEFTLRLGMPKRAN
ncbi:MAG: Ig-like domain-containing protein [Candidatus Eisenbacteria bacterium]|uniref:Ig-like domain-containing protein n=1 Tax=Eiseniibacteriota bacterium TaxID=2212470 RepID=A0A933W8R6_UNCEI|nr:Ig-like domain-containing protein [Candidatus Eisenbacteria bacterium]